MVAVLQPSGNSLTPPTGNHQPPATPGMADNEQDAESQEEKHARVVAAVKARAGKPCPYDRDRLSEFIQTAGIRRDAEGLLYLAKTRGPHAGSMGEPVKSRYMIRTSPTEAEPKKPLPPLTPEERLKLAEANLRAERFLKRLDRKSVALQAERRTYLAEAV